MNQQMMKQSFIARAKTLAHVMTRSTNVKVTVSGDTAYNTSGLINIPAGDFTDKEWLKMVTGWIDHELGHEKHTNDVAYARFARQGQLQRHLLNIVEDVWMERAVGREFPGARQNLAILAELAVKRELFQSPANTLHPLSAVTSFLLYGGRAKIIGQHCLDDYADIALAEVEKHFGDEFALKLAAIRDDIDAVESTAGAVKIAQAVIDLLQEEKDNQEQQQQSDDDADADADDSQTGDSDDDADADADDNQSGDSDDDADADADDNQSDDSDEDADADADDNQSGDSDDDADADADDNQSGDSDDDADADADDNQSGDSDDDADADADDNQSGDSDDDADADADDSPTGDSDDDADADSDDNQPGDSDDDADADSEPSNGKPTAQQIIDAIEKAMNEADEADIQDFHDALAKQLGKDAEEAKEENEDVAECAHALTQDTVNAQPSVYLGGSHMLDQLLSKRLSGGVYQTMHKVLFDQVQSLETTRRVGTRLVNRRLSGIPAGNMSVFARRAETQDVSAAISVLIDASGSMGWADAGDLPAMPMANACAYAFALGLNKAGVASEFIYYGKNGYCCYEAYTAKRFDEQPISSRFCAMAVGEGTPTGEAMQFTLSSLLLRPEGKKMMFVLTDGNPNSAESVRAAALVAKAFGIKVIPVGIKTDAVKGFEEGEFITVQEPAELTTALRQAVRMKLFN